ncbi:MAG TPA: sigma-70 family RNA polymerase sigma factor [Verrucomicrobiae bacterium]
MILARKAKSLGPKTVLPGWLCRTARNVSANALTRQRRRQHREHEAYMQSTLNRGGDAPSPPTDEEIWTQIAPLLDDALGELGQKDHDALVLRFFENKSLGEVGAAIGASEDTARMRVNRALEKLRKIFTKRGVSSTTVILGGTISANSVQAAPVALAKSVTAVAIAKDAAASTSTLTLIKGALKIMAWTKAKTAIVAGAIVLLAAGTTTVIIQRAVSSANTVVFEELFRHPFNDPATVKKLENAPTILILRPTQYPNGGMGFRAPDGKCIFVNASVRALIRFAYGFPGTARIIFPANFPSAEYDYLNTLPKGQREVLRKKLKKQFGLVAHSEIRETDVFLLKVKDSEELKSHLARNQQSAEPGTFRLSSGIPNNQVTGFETIGPVELTEIMRQKPIIDQTGSTAFYQWTDEEMKSPSHNLNQLGLELIPTNMPIELLMVEKAKD